MSPRPDPLHHTLGYESKTSLRLNQTAVWGAAVLFVFGGVLIAPMLYSVVHFLRHNGFGGYGLAAALLCTAPPAVTGVLCWIAAFTAVAEWWRPAMTPNDERQTP